MLGFLISDASVEVFLLLPVLLQGSSQPVLSQIGSDVLSVRGITVQLCPASIFVDLFHQSGTKNSRFRLTTAEESVGIIRQTHRGLPTRVICTLGDRAIHVFEEAL